MIRLRYLLLLLIILSLCSLFIGVSNISIMGLLYQDYYQWEIFLSARIPRLISIIIAAASLSICGLVLQHLSRNKFVSPTTAGLNDFASFGILIAILLFPKESSILQVSIASIFTLIGAIFFMYIISTLKINNTVFIPLIGMVLGSIIHSITVFFALQWDLLQNINSWLQGDFSAILIGKYETLYFSIPALLLIYFYAEHFIIAGLGEDFSLTLGLNYKKIIFLGLLLVSIVTAIVITTVGIIPFLGLIVPNIVSLYIGDNIKKTLFHTMTLGVVIVLSCDLVGRIIIFPFEIPVSLIMGIMGSAIFISLLLKKTSQ